MGALLYQLVFDLISEQTTALRISDFRINNHFLLKNTQGVMIPMKVAKKVKDQYLSCYRIRFFCDYRLNAERDLELRPLPIHDSHRFHMIRESNSYYQARSTEVPYYHIYYLENSLKLLDDFSLYCIQIQRTPDDLFKDLNTLSIEFELIRRTIIDQDLNVWDC